MRAGLLIVPAVDAWRQATKALDPRIAAPDSNSFAVSQRLSIDSSRTTVKFSAAPRRSDASSRVTDSSACSCDTLYLAWNSSDPCKQFPSFAAGCEVLGHKRSRLGKTGTLMPTKTKKPQPGSKLELRFAEQFQQSMLESSVTAVGLIDLEGRFVTVSQRTVEITGYSKRELRGKLYSLLVASADQPRINAILEGVLREGQGHPRLETTMVCKDGTVKSIRFDVKPIRSEGRIVGAVTTAEDVTAAMRAEEALRQSEAELRLLSSRLMDLQDSERRRIARELHDGTAQNLFALNIGLSRLLQQTATESSRNTLEECLSLCAQSREEIRTLSHVLHPPMLDEAGLVSALKWYVEGFSDRSGINVELRADPGLGRLPIDIETDLFRVFQECLANIHRHSGSRRAAVHVDRNANGISLRIQDWGCGIPAEIASGRASASPGIGIPGMHERLGQHRGHLEIQSSSKGTVVTATVPLNAVRSPHDAVKGNRK